VEDRILGLEEKIDIKEKTDEYMDKSLPNYERNTSDICNSIRR
jgi:hypothetical protein